MQVKEIRLILEDVYHTSGQTEGAFIDILKDHEGRAYIPATQVKGVMRCEAERILRATEGISCSVTGDPAVRVCDEVKGGMFGCDVCRLFGMPRTEGGGAYIEGKLRFTSFLPTDGNKTPSEVRTSVTISRESGTNVSGNLFSMSFVPAGSMFTGYVMIRSDLSENEERLFSASLHAMKAYGLGKGRSRGCGGIREIRIADVPAEQFGVWSR